MEGTVRNLYTFVNEEAESWMAVVKTVKELGPERSKRPSGGRTLTVSEQQRKKDPHGSVSFAHKIMDCGSVTSLSR